MYKSIFVDLGLNDHTKIHICTRNTAAKLGAGVRSPSVTAQHLASGPHFWYIQCLHIKCRSNISGVWWNIHQSVTSHVSLLTFLY